MCYFSPLKICINKTTGDKCWPGCGRRESALLREDVYQCSNYERFLKQSERRIPDNAAIILFSVENICAPKLTAALIIRADIQKQTKCLFIY